MLQPLLEDLRRFGAIVGSRGGVGSHGLQGDGHRARPARPPTQQIERRGAMSLGILDRIRQRLARVRTEIDRSGTGAIRTENHVTDRQETTRRGVHIHRSHQNLAARGGIGTIPPRIHMVKPAVHPGRSQIGVDGVRGKPSGSQVGHRWVGRGDPAQQQQPQRETDAAAWA